MKMLTFDISTLIADIRTFKKPKLYAHMRLDVVDNIRSHKCVGESLMVNNGTTLYDAADYYIADDRRAALDWYLTEMPSDRNVVMMAIKYEKISTLHWLINKRRYEVKNSHVNHAIVSNKINVMKYLLTRGGITQNFTNIAAGYGCLEIL